MPRFFVEPDMISEGFVQIHGDDAHHISYSLRMAKGDIVTVCDTEGLEYKCSLADFSDKCVVAKIISRELSRSEPPFYAKLYQALPKGDKFDTVIQKAVECGVSEIIPFISERCIAKESCTEENKQKRRNRISLEASKQSGRGRIASVHSVLSFEKMLEDACTGSDIVLFCYEGEGTLPLGKILHGEKERLSKVKYPVVSVIIGSEGGFSQGEAERAKNCGVFMCGLGNRILRTETASGFVLACLVYEFEL